MDERHRTHWTAEQLALRSGAETPLELVGEGSEGIVFRDYTNRVFKVPRHAAPTNYRMLYDAVEYVHDLRVAYSTHADLVAHLPSGIRWVNDTHTVVRDYVDGMPGRWRDMERLWHWQDEVLRPQSSAIGWLPPEFKEDSYIVDAHDPSRFVLVDFGFCSRIGTRFVEYAWRVIRGLVPHHDEGSFLMLLLRREVAEGVLSEAEYRHMEELLAPIPAR